MAKLTFYPIGNADTSRIDLDGGQKLLFDYANMRDPNDSADKRIDLRAALLADLKNAKRDYYDIVAFTHLDEDHIKGATEFFRFEHDEAYQGQGRIEIRELWVPAAVILEDVDENDKEASIIQAEARYRLIRNEGVRVFSRPDKLDKWLEEHCSDLTDESMIVGAGQLVPGFSKEEQGVEFFVHSPFSEVCDGEVIDRNEASLAFQAVFAGENGDTHVLMFADTAAENLAKIVTITEDHAEYHGGVDRLAWDIVNLPHHCSYLSLNTEGNKGKDKTEPLPDIARLYEEHGGENPIAVSSSDPIPTADTIQPPHRQAANYYKELDGVQFKVTMQEPTASSPEPLEIEIGEGGATIKKRLPSSSITIANQTIRSGRAG